MGNEKEEPSLRTTLDKQNCIDEQEREVRERIEERSSVMRTGFSLVCSRSIRTQLQLGNMWSVIRYYPTSIHDTAHHIPFIISHGNTNYSQFEFAPKIFDKNLFITWYTRLETAAIEIMRVTLFSLPILTPTLT